MTDRSFEERNARVTEELRRLVGTLSTEDFAAGVGDAWTVATCLAHLAFWDRWQVVRWRDALATGLAVPADVSDNVPDLANAALEPTWRALPGETAAVLALEAAAEIDALVAALPDASVAAAPAAGRVRLLDRSIHRLEHVAQVRRGLGRAER
jgi:Mycothiol maleylpyruvate isomerase N-terminal domain